MFQYLNLISKGTKIIQGEKFQLLGFFKAMTQNNTRMSMIIRNESFLSECK